MNNKSFVSIIIPTMDRNKKLSRLLKSVYDSTFKDFEVIVVNNSAKKIIQNKKYNNFQVLENGSNLGSAYARTVGAKLAKGQYVLFIDDDNVIEKAMIEKMSKTLDENNNIIAVGPLTFYFSNKNKFWFLGGKINLLTSKATFYKKITENKLFKTNLFVTEVLHNAFMVRKKLGDEVSWFDKEIFMTGAEYDLFVKIKKNYPNNFMVTNLEAIDYHDVLNSSALKILKFKSELRIYYFARNRGLLIGRYGTLIDRISVSFVFYPLLTLFYLSVFIIEKKWSFIVPHLRGTIIGYLYILKGQ